MRCRSLFLLLPLIITPLIHADTLPPYRVVILTDMTHDDGNSFIRYLYYGHLFETEAIIVTNQLPDFRFDDAGPWKKIDQILDAYETEYPQLIRHQPELPSPAAYRDVTYHGHGAIPIIWLTNEGSFDSTIAGRHVTTEWGSIDFDDWIGEGLNPNGQPKDSPGSEHLLKVFAKEDDRPIFVQSWGGPITFIQALYRYQQSHSPEQVTQLMEKLHFYCILFQDITFDFLIDLDQATELLCGNFGTVQSTYDKQLRLQPNQLLYDGGHFWTFVWSRDPNWVKPITEADVNGHGPLSDLYDHGGEGDSPAFFYLISADLGLNDPLEPTHGSWGGRFIPMESPFPEGYYMTCGVDPVALNRWLPVIHSSFMNRLRFSTTAPGFVNREPLPRLKGFPDRQIIRLSVEPGQRLTLDASGSVDPDGDQMFFRWFHYDAADSYPRPVKIPDPDRSVQTIEVPDDIGDHTIHLILELSDDGDLPLTQYRRVILSAD